MTALNIKNENEILESQELRNELLSRVEVLDKVKTLFLLPKLEMMTTQQVAEYYEVDRKTFEKCYERNMNEISPDGTKKLPVSEITNLLLRQNVGARNHRGYKEFDIAEGVTMRLPNSGSVLMFSKRAVLRVGMLLRDSEIAKEVRTQLLNVFEKATPEQRVEDMETEQRLLNNIGVAYGTGDPMKILTATMELDQFRQRHIAVLKQENEEIKTDNQLLSGEILKWSDRSQVNRIVRYLAHALCMDHKYIYSDLYKELLYKHKINLNSRKTKRKKDSRLSTVAESEWPAVQQSLAALCEKYGFSPEKVYQKALKYQSQ